jgi:Cupin superfamily protein
MDHRLVLSIEKALNWSGPDDLGRVFARGALPDLELAARLLTPTRLLDIVMRRSLSAARIRCLQEGVDVHPQAYLRAQPIRRAEPVQMVDMQRLGLLLAAGCTLVVDGANVYDPTLEIACRALQWWAHELVTVNIYLTTGDAAGFDLHWDDHDVIVMQLAGEKSWEVRGLSRPVPMFRDAAPNPDPPQDAVWAGTMQAGDVMHIPRGYWHQATRQDRGDGFSLHATFGFPKRTGVDWLNWLADQSRQHELFRHDIDRWATPVELRAQHITLIDGAVGMVATRPLREFLATREWQQPAGRHISTHGLFGEPGVVACVADFPPNVVHEDGQVVLRAAGKEIRFAAEAAPALLLLLDGSPVDVQAATMATGVDAAVLAEVLVEEDICAEVTVELATGYQDMLLKAP